MKYVAIVEIEFTTSSESVDPLETLRAILERSRRLICTQIDEGPLAEHYHIVEMRAEQSRAEQSRLTEEDAGDKALDEYGEWGAS